MTEIGLYADAWRHSFHACLDLAHTLSDSDWEEPTGCPTWTVWDVYLHLIEGEASLLDDPVLGRAPATPTALTARLRTLYDLRDAQLTAWTSSSGQLPVPLVRQARMRVVDCWIHEQDIRIAIDRAGNLDSPGARLVHTMFQASVAYSLARRADLPADTRVRFIIDGDLAIRADVIIDDVGNGQQVDIDNDQTPVATVSTDWPTFVQLCGGRVLSRRARLTLTGDPEIGRRVVAALAVTP